MQVPNKNSIRGQTVFISAADCPQHKLCTLTMAFLSKDEFETQKG